MRRAALLAVIAVVVCSVSTARAEEGRVQILRDPIPYTNVLDAADDDQDDPFDLNLQVGYGWSRYRAMIDRETASPTGAASFANVGRYERVRQTLDLNLELGLFKDFSAYAYMPIVLSDAQHISSANANMNPAEDVAAGFGANGFRSPTRSGFDGITTGLAWSPLNQAREREVPTWVLLVDTTTPIGRIMHPCNAADLTQPQCGNRPGMIRGTQGIHFETRLSRRYRFVEPYFGLGARGEIPTRQISAIRPVSNLSGYQRTFPPVVAQFTFGAAFIPYEHLRRFQRLVIDLRVQTEYVSAGRDFTPLFDMLGSSPALNNTIACQNGDTLTAPSMCNGMSQGAGAQGVGVPFTGVTDIDAYGRVGGRVTLDYMASKWMRFTFTTNMLYVTAHYLSTAAACNAGVSPTGANAAFQGTCDVGIVNPEYRQQIDGPGQRFHIQGGLQLDFLASAVAQF